MCSFFVCYIFAAKDYTNTDEAVKATFATA